MAALQAIALLLILNLLVVLIVWSDDDDVKEVEIELIGLTIKISQISEKAVVTLVLTLSFTVLLIADALGGC